MSGPLRVHYRFDLPDGSHRVLDLDFDPLSFRLTTPPPCDPPFWTELRFSQCANCPLSVGQHPRCPAALNMWVAVDLLDALASYDEVRTTVVQAQRTVHAETTVQQALSSVFGLIMATAGCPWTDRLRPMARFHLPFASEEETLYRSVSMYLLARELCGTDQAGGFTPLEDLYENLHVVNRGMARRLGAATRTDPARNAIALLDAHTLLLPAALDSSLDELRPLFDAWRRGLPAI